MAKIKRAIKAIADQIKDAINAYIESTYATENAQREAINATDPVAFGSFLLKRRMATYGKVGDNEQSVSVTDPTTGKQSTVPVLMPIREYNGLDDNDPVFVFLLDPARVTADNLTDALAELSSSTDDFDFDALIKASNEKLTIDQLASVRAKVDRSTGKQSASKAASKLADEIGSDTVKDILDAIRQDPEAFNRYLESLKAGK